MTHPLSTALTALATAALCASVLGCSSANDGGSDPTPEPDDPGPLAIGQQVPFPTTDWTIASPESMGMDAAILEKAREYAFDFDGDGDGEADTNTQSVVVVRGGAIVAEWYAPDKGPESPAPSWSAAKSFASTLIGIAIDQGLIDGVHQPLKTWFPEWDGQPQGDITLQAVLWMQSGLDFEENYGSVTSEVVGLSLSGDTHQYVLGLDIAAEPNTRWYYSSGDTQLLTAIVERLTGKSASEYAREHLFAPIGMTADWWVDGQGHAFGYCCLDAPTRDFAKFGLLFLRGGLWDGKQVVSSGWVTEATTTAATQYGGYAYQWWLGDSLPGIPVDDLYFAEGKDEQKIFVIPSLDLVVAKNTLYEPPPGEAVAPNGWIEKFTPGGLTEYGSVAPTFWEDTALLAPIIESIEGGPAVDFTPTRLGNAPDDPMLCRAQSRDYGEFCEEVNGCVCDLCAAELLECDANAGCAEIARCAFQVGCRGIDCVEPCKDAIEASGGVATGNASVALALRLSECQNACPVACP